MGNQPGVDGGWVIDLNCNEQILARPAPGVGLLAFHSGVAAAWVRTLCLSQGSLDASFVDPVGQGRVWRQRHGPRRFELTGGLYEVQSTRRGYEAMRRFVVVAQGQPQLIKDREAALREAGRLGVLTVPAPDELWGWVRSLCAQGQWHEVRRDLWPLIQDAALAEQIEAYCAAAQAHKHKQVRRDVALPPLKGTPKQLPWAEDLRARRVSELRDVEEGLDSLRTAWPELYAAAQDVVEEVACARAELEREAQARYWISRRVIESRLGELSGIIRMCLRRGAPDLTKEEQFVIRENEELVQEHLAAQRAPGSPTPQEKKSDGE